jgi:HEAT repeat protein
VIDPDAPAATLYGEDDRPITEPAVPAARAAAASLPPPGSTRSSPPESQPPSSSEDAVLLPSDPPAAADDDGPEISVGAAEVDWTPELGGPPPMPDSQVVVAAQRPLRAHSSAELRLPSIIVNIEHDIEALVARLLEGDEKVLDRLAALGASAASYLVSRFPGPIREPDRFGTPEPASQRGPILLALARIGQPAAPFLAVRSNDRDSSIRSWATLLLGEIPSVDSAIAVSRRVADSSAEVRRAALEAGKLLQGHEDARTALRDKVLSIAESTVSIESRVAAIEAIAHFRDGRATPRLVRLLANKDEVGQSAEWALGVLTRQAFGRDTAAWDTWWKEKGGDHRIEWLIDSLNHDEAEIRRAAGEELKGLTKEYFGYYDDLRKGERAKSQRRYRDWWETTGQAKFLR